MGKSKTNCDEYSLNKKSQLNKRNFWKVSSLGMSAKSCFYPLAEYVISTNSYEMFNS